MLLTRTMTNNKAISFNDENWDKGIITLRLENGNPLDLLQF